MLLTVQVDMEMLNWSAFFAKVKNGQSKTKLWSSYYPFKKKKLKIKLYLGAWIILCNNENIKSESSTGFDTKIF